MHSNGSSYTVGGAGDALKRPVLTEQCDVLQKGISYLQERLGALEQALALYTRPAEQKPRAAALATSCGGMSAFERHIVVTCDALADATTRINDIIMRLPQ